MKKSLIFLIALTVISFSCKSDKKEVDITNNSEVITDSISNIKEKPLSDIKIKPINHASFIIEHEDIVIYVDPVGGPEIYKNEKIKRLLIFLFATLVSYNGSSQNSLKTFI